MDHASAVRSAVFAALVRVLWVVLGARAADCGGRNFATLFDADFLAARSLAVWRPVVAADFDLVALFGALIHQTCCAVVRITGGL